ncbi:sensor histidine kinase [Kordia antarctica]|nr:histidine kinase [Kordia antarctica]
MNTKTIVQILKKTILSLSLVLIVIFIYGITMIGFPAMGETTEKIISNLIEISLFVGPYLFFTILTFYSIDNWMVQKGNTNKTLMYLFSTILIPAIVTGISVVILLLIKKGNLSFTHAGYVIILNTVVGAGIALFFSIIHYLKYKFKTKFNNQDKIVWKRVSVYKKVFLYALGLSAMYMIFLIPFFPRFGGFSFEGISVFYLRSIITAFICWHLVLLFNKLLEHKISFFALLGVTTMGTFIIMQFTMPLLSFITLLSNREYEAVMKIFNFKRELTYIGADSLYVIFCVLFYQFLYFNQKRSVEQKAFKAQIGKQTEKYESLRRQLSPHFLFNNINVLTSLIEENPQKAVRFSESLGDIYRHFLRQEDEDVVSLESALKFSKNYLELLKYRYEDAFHYTLPEKTKFICFIIPLALQQVIENTIKHNEVSNEMPLKITIRIQDDYLIVQNTKRLKKLTEVSKGTGIENIKSRYHFLTEKEVIIEETATLFTIKLPLLNLENS